jgi:hypothetical protein
VGKYFNGGFCFFIPTLAIFLPIVRIITIYFKMLTINNLKLSIKIEEHNPSAKTQARNIKITIFIVAFTNP